MPNPTDIEVARHDPKAYAAHIGFVLQSMTDEQRMEFLRALSEDFCLHCGSWGDGACYCTRDD